MLVIVVPSLWICNGIVTGALVAPKGVAAKWDAAGLSAPGTEISCAKAV